MHVPQVHAFNVLRFVFADKELTTETVGFAAKGLTAAIKGFSSPHWEVRFVSVDFRDFFAEVIVTHACASLSRAVCASATARARLVLDVLRNVQAGARASRAGTRARERGRHRGVRETNLEGERRRRGVVGAGRVDSGWVDEMRAERGAET